MRPVALVLGLCASLVACASPDGDARVPLEGPPRARYDGLAPLLERRCGTLDCHGRAPRNLRIYGYGGLRLLPTDRPDGRETTPEERDASFRSLIALEPELTNAVARDHGGEERLSVVRKALGIEAHKAEARITAGEDADTCLRSFVRDVDDGGACARAAATW